MFSFFSNCNLFQFRLDYIFLLFSIDLLVEYRFLGCLHFLNLHYLCLQCILWAFIDNRLLSTIILLSLNHNEFIFIYFLFFAQQLFLLIVRVTTRVDIILLLYMLRQDSSLVICGIWYLVLGYDSFLLVECLLLLILPGIYLQGFGLTIFDFLVFSVGFF